MDATKKLVTKTYRHLMQDSLYANSIYLMLSTALGSLLGLLFWIICAHLFRSSEIGLATTLITASMLISSISLVGYNNTFVRFLPRSQNPSEDMSTGVIIVALISIILGFGYVMLLPHLSPQLSIVHHNIFYAFSVVVIMAIAALNTITDSIFIAYRHAKYIMLIYGAMGVLKIFLPILLISFQFAGIFFAYGIAMAFGLVLSLAAIKMKLGIKFRMYVNLSSIKKTFSFSSGTYLAGLGSIAPALILPMLILNKIGPNQAAYYYMAMMIANLLYTIPVATAHSLFAEGSHNEEDLASQVRKATRGVAYMGIPAMLIIIFFAPIILHIFGRQYSIQALTLLRLLAISCIFVSINYIQATALTVRLKVRATVYISVIGAACTLLLSYFLISWGLKGIGIAWLISQGLMSVAYSYSNKYYRNTFDAPLL